MNTGTIVTVTPNPALDLTYTVKGITLGTSHRVAEPLGRAGGKGLNVARVAHAQGHSVLALAPVGGATGRLFRAELEASGVPASLVSSPRETRRSLAFVDTVHSQDPTLFNEAGPDQPAEVLAELLTSARAAAAAGTPGRRPAVIVGAGSLPGQSGIAPRGGAGFYVRLARAAASAGAHCILDTSGAALLAAAEAGPALLKPNEHELREATGLASPMDGAAELLRRGAQRVLVSRGAKGMFLMDASDPGAFLFARLPEALDGNPTGAGDAAVAAVAACLAEGVHNRERILRRAVAWSAAAVLMPAAGEISPQHTALADTVIITRESYPCP